MSLFDSVFKATAGRMIEAIYGKTVTYRVVSTGVETQGLAWIEEQVGALDNKGDQLFTIRDSFVAVPVPGDQITDPGGNVWTVVKVRSNNGMHELRCFLPEVIA